MTNRRGNLQLNATTQASTRPRSVQRTATADFSISRPVVYSVDGVNARVWS